MGQKQKKTKAPKKTKDVDMRKMEVEMLRQQMEEVGLNSTMEGVKEIYKQLEIFETEGVGSSGLVKVPFLGRVIEYRLSVTPHIISGIGLREGEGEIKK